MADNQRFDREEARAIGARMLDVREALGLTQEQLRNHMREKLGRAPSTSRISKLERGDAVITLKDIDVFARVDPQQRGREWIGWGDTLPRGRVATRGVVQQRGPNALDSAAAARRKQEDEAGDRPDSEGPSRASG